MNPTPTPDSILQTGFAFWSSKVLLTAVEFSLFTVLGQRRLTGAELGKELGLHPRGIADFLDALVAMKFLDMLIEFGEAFDYSGADFKKWCREAGFIRFEVIHLAGPSSAAIAYK